MDSLTQLTLGAAVGEAVLGRKVGRPAMLWGAICGTIPDLDVFIPLGDAVKDFTYHRGPSHSLLVLAALTPIVVALILKIHPHTLLQRHRWYLLVYLAFLTHVLLDCFTVYGTQIFWPIDTTPITWSTIFIIDPIYTFLLSAGVLAALLIRGSPLGSRFNSAGLFLSTLYLVWSVGVKAHVESVSRASLAQQGVHYERLLITPTPLNTLLWRVLAMDHDGYYEGFYSLLDESPDVSVKRYNSETKLLQGIEDHWPVQRLQWFTKGFYAVSQVGQSIVITDLRMGLEPDYVFNFEVGKVHNPHTEAVPAKQMPISRQLEQLRWVWNRI